MASKRTLIYTAFSCLAALTSAAPLVTSNDTEIITATDSQPDFNVLHSLHQRSPMDPVGPSSGQGSSAAAAAAGSSSSSRSYSSSAVIIDESLRSYERKGRGYYMQIVLADVERTNSMLNNEHGISGVPQRWQQVIQPLTYMNGGWSARDTTDQLVQAQFEMKYKSTFDHLIVGQAEEELVLHGEEPLRPVSTVLWPRGPNRMIRMTQDGPWKSKNERERVGAALSLSISKSLSSCNLQRLT